MTPDRLAVLARVADALPDLDRPLLVAVDGGDGAGKTWFADELATLLVERDRAIVRASVDDFHHPRSHRHAQGRTGETVWSRSFDYHALRRHLLDPWCAGAGSPYRCRHHDLATDAHLQEPPETVPEHGVLLVDGVFAQREELRGCWDLVVWLEVADEERVRRMAARDGVPADVSHPDQRRYLDAQQIYRAPPTPSARPTSSSTTPTPRFQSWHRRSLPRPVGTAWVGTSSGRSWPIPRPPRPSTGCWAPTTRLPRPAQPEGTTICRVGGPVSVTPFCASNPAIGWCARRPIVQVQPPAFLTSLVIARSSVGVSSVTAKTVGHIVPSSRAASASKPNWA